MPDAPLILFPGMGVDHRLFVAHQSAFPNLIVPKWLTPFPAETLSDYAARFARELDPKCPCFVGGASFGGLVAIEAARHLQAKGCFLIGSVRSPDEFPSWVRACRYARAILPWVPFKAATHMAALLSKLPHLVTGAPLHSLFHQIADTDPQLIRWSCGALLTWKAPSPSGCPIFQIHGKNDFILPVRHTKPDLIVPEAGHILSLTHPEQVNRFLARFTGGPPAPH
jgi:pimeloyl-ACP methyl ester carboxylesterase